MTIKQIEKAQTMANMKFEAAKKLSALLKETEAEYKKLGGTSEEWEAEAEEIQRMVFEEEG